MKKRVMINCFLGCFAFTIVFISCKKGNNQANCKQDVLISKTEYESAPADKFSIISLKISVDCLTIKFSASGCNGNSWTTKLIDWGGVAQSNPPQRTLRLSLDNKELGESVVVKEISLNIKDLQVEGADKVWLNISGKSILYEY